MRKKYVAAISLVIGIGVVLMMQIYVQEDVAGESILTKRSYSTDKGEIIWNVVKIVHTINGLSALIVMPCYAIKQIKSMKQKTFWKMII